MHYKQNNKESKSYVQGLRPFGNTLPRGIKGILKKNGYNYSEIVSKWNIMVGKDISNYSYPKSIKIEKGNLKGTLIINVKRGNEITLEYSKKEIIDKINSFFGYNCISQVTLKIVQEKIKTTRNKFPKIKNLSKINEKIDNVKNNQLKSSLNNFLKAFNERNK